MSMISFWIFDNITQVLKYHLCNLISEPSPLSCARCLNALTPRCGPLLGAQSQGHRSGVGWTAQVLQGQAHCKPKPIRKGKSPLLLTANAIANSTNTFYAFCLFKVLSGADAAVGLETGRGSKSKKIEKTEPCIEGKAHPLRWKMAGVGARTKLWLWHNSQWSASWKLGTHCLWGTDPLSLIPTRETWSEWQRPWQMALPARKAPQPSCPVGLSHPALRGPQWRGPQRRGVSCSFSKSTSSKW